MQVFPRLDTVTGRRDDFATSTSLMVCSSQEYCVDFRGIALRVVAVGNGSSKRAHLEEAIDRHDPLTRDVSA